MEETVMLALPWTSWSQSFSRFFYAFDDLSLLEVTTKTTWHLPFFIIILRRQISGKWWWNRMMATTTTTMMMMANDGKKRGWRTKKQRKRERWCTPLYCALCMISSLNFQVKSLERKEETILPLLLFHHPFSWCRLMQDEERNEGEAHVGCRDDSHVLHAG